MTKNLRMTPAALCALADWDITNFLTATIPGGIEAQEHAGQQALVHSSMLPKKTGYGTTRQQLEALGIVFSDDADDLFVNCTLPHGWSKVATDHDMHSSLVDDKGRVRADIFYKAAFYDRKADITLYCRYHAGSYPEDGNWENYNQPRIGAVKDYDNTILWRTTESCDYQDYSTENILSDQATRWLIEHYPNYRDPLAYWDNQIEGDNI